MGLRLQIVRGGREPGLRIRNTRAALAELAPAGLHGYMWAVSTSVSLERERSGRSAPLDVRIAPASRTS